MNVRVLNNFKWIVSERRRRYTHAPVAMNFADCDSGYLNRNANAASDQFGVFAKNSQCSRPDRSETENSNIDSFRHSCRFYVAGGDTGYEDFRRPAYL
jgi:hypothetical protein